MARIKILLLLSLLASIAECQQFNAQDATLAMLERVNEPLFIPKCEKGVLLELPASYMPDRYQKVSDPLKNRFSEASMATTRITIKMVTVPDISDLMTLPRLATFSNFVPMHRNLGARLISIFMGMRSVEDFFSVAAFLRDRLNPSLFVYGFSVALLHRPDCRSIRLPPVTETFPGRFVDGAVFVRAREESSIMSDQSLVPMRATIEIPRDYTATDLETEHRLAYFREDLGINLHHWHWHLIYPFSGPREVVQKDRRGELFYYMHQQVIGRYDFERMCNKLPRTARLQNLNEPIEEAYFPKLNTQISSRNWAGRPNRAILRDINREADQLKFDIADLDRWRSRILEAIHKGRVELANGTSVPLTEQNGIDILGDMVEPSDYSLNRQFYGDFHNLMHVAVALVHDPDARHLETFGVLGESSTAMRDPVFYRIHATVNDIFSMHKLSLPRYTVQQLDFPGVRVTGVELNTPNSPKNTFQTFWQKSTVDLSRGMDFFPRGPVYARFTHLTHTEYQLTINIDNQSGRAKQGLVRVMLAPKLDERGQNMPIVEQRNLFIEIDKFFVSLNPGANTAVRSSRQSAVTIPFEQTFRDLEANRPSNNDSINVQDDFNFCGCGWPHHMLIPKGSPEGFPSVLFVMVSDYETDWIPKPNNDKRGRCAEAASYCGIRDQQYPDRRAMGYPFDRLPRSGVPTLQSFLTPNMGLQDVSIKFTDRTVDNTPNNGNIPRLVEGVPTTENMDNRPAPPNPRPPQQPRPAVRPVPAGGGNRRPIGRPGRNQQAAEDFSNLFRQDKGPNSLSSFYGNIQFPSNWGRSQNRPWSYRD